MTILVLRHGTVSVSPSLLRRILFRETERIAVCVAGANGWLWIWDGTSKPVDAATVKLIDRALIAERRRALAEAQLENVTFLVVPPEPPPTG